MPVGINHRTVSKFSPVFLAGNLFLLIACVSSTHDAYTETIIQKEKKSSLPSREIKDTKK